MSFSRVVQHAAYSLLYYTAPSIKAGLRRPCDAARRNRVEYDSRWRAGDAGHRPVTARPLRAVYWPARRDAPLGTRLHPAGPGRVHREILRDGGGPARARLCRGELRLARTGRLPTGRFGRPRRVISAVSGISTATCWRSGSACWSGCARVRSSHWRIPWAAPSPSTWRNAVSRLSSAWCSRLRCWASPGWDRPDVPRRWRG